MERKLARCFWLLLLIESILFVTLIATSMTDEKPPEMVHYIYGTLKYVFGFPLVLLNRDFPFFLDSRESIIVVILFTILKTLILSYVIIGLLNIFGRMLQKDRGNDSVI